MISSKISKGILQEWNTIPYHKVIFQKLCLDFKEQWQVWKTIEAEQSLLHPRRTNCKVCIHLSFHPSCVYPRCQVNHEEFSVAIQPEKTTIFSPWSHPGEKWALAIKCLTRSWAQKYFLHMRILRPFSLTFSKCWVLID